jgi:glucosyl-3-phosphoglycerate synthase
MSDFAQSGLICTLQRLNDSHLPQLEAELRVLASKRPIALVLPCHGADLGRAALVHICTELEAADWIEQVVVSMNGLDAAGMEHAGRVFARLPQRVRLLWNDGPKMAPLLSEMLGTFPHGKGLNVWAALGLVCAEGRAEIVATQDCDVASFQRVGLARLCYPLADRRLGFAFAKMYYSRVTDRLYGRVSRLFFAPLLQALLRVAGHQPLLDFLLSFRYPLAGEIAIDRKTAMQIPFATGWALEVRMLCELFRRIEPGLICQVDGGGGYDHKHQPIGAGSGLAAMCAEIGAALLAEMRTEGLALDDPTRAAIARAYERTSEFALRRSAALAVINGLPFEAEEERAATAAFGSSLRSAREMPAGVLPSWDAVLRTRPTLGATLRDAAVDIGA